jgi:hypothetical protein
MVQNRRSMWPYTQLVRHKEIFIKDFKFIPKEEHLRETTQQIKIFLEKLTPSYTKGKREDDY